MTHFDAAATVWHPIPITPYGAILHVPEGWEAMPPEPANGPEIMRAAGGAGRNLIVFKVPAGGRSANEIADVAQGKLEARGYGDFTRIDVRFAGQPGVALDFVTRNSKGDEIYRTREYFAVRGNAGYVLGMGSRTWDDHLALIEAIAERFELTGQV
jgi:hypothetical protein